MRYKANLETLPAILTECEEKIKNLPPDVLNAIGLSIEEAIVNVIHYSGSPEVDIDIHISNSAVTVIISDWGKPFNPCEYQPKVDSDASLQERPIGGLGIFFIKKMVDEIKYDFIDGMNRLTFTKKLP